MMQEETPMTNTLWMGDVSFEHANSQIICKARCLSLVFVVVLVPYGPRSVSESE